jgi:hypothetical protein
MNQLELDIIKVQAALESPDISILEKEQIKPLLENAKRLLLDQEIARKLDLFVMYNISLLRNDVVMRARIIEDVKRRIASGKITIEEALVEIEWIFMEGEGNK